MVKHRNGPDLIAIAIDHGWEVRRHIRKGNGAVMYHPLSHKTLTLPYSVKDAGMRHINWIKQIERDSLLPKEGAENGETETSQARGVSGLRQQALPRKRRSHQRRRDRL